MGSSGPRVFAVGLAVSIAVVGCAQASMGLPSATGPSAALGQVQTESPLALPGYVPGGPGHATPNPVACATSSAVPPHTTAAVMIGFPAPAANVSVHVGDTVLVSAVETCEFAWHIGSMQPPDASVLSEIGGSVIPDGAQGTAWVEYRAVHSGSSRLAVFGGCSIPYPRPAEPSGMQLVCDDVGHAFVAHVQVSG